jgi:CheY-like chemotaxis protein
LTTSDNTGVTAAQGGTSPACAAINFLLVDDNPGDVRLAREAFRESKIRQDIMVARSGAEALALLQQDGKDTERPRPDIILLDVNLPDMCGLELLNKIKTNDHLKRIPVVMLSTSSAEEDIKSAYDNHANCYIIKPVELEQFIQIMKSLTTFWASIARLPGT